MCGMCNGMTSERSGEGGVKIEKAKKIGDKAAIPQRYALCNTRSYCPLRLTVYPPTLQLRTVTLPLHCDAVYYAC